MTDTTEYRYRLKNICWDKSYGHDEKQRLLLMNLGLALADILDELRLLTAALPQRERGIGGTDGTTK